MPRRWRQRTNTYDVRDEFLALFPFRIIQFLQVRKPTSRVVLARKPLSVPLKQLPKSRLTCCCPALVLFSNVHSLLEFQEVLGVVLTPFILIKVMPRLVPSIIDFVKNVTITVPDLGAVCGYSMFDLERYGESIASSYFNHFSNI